MQKEHYREIYEKQDIHWWYVGMREINISLLDKHLLSKKNLKILDAGCGPGAMLPSLSKLGEVTGVDLSNDALKFAKNRGKVKVKKADITKLPFKNNSFDLVLCMDVLYHAWVKDNDKAIKEFHRVLKPDGILLIREPAYDWLRGNQDAVGLTSRRFNKSTMKRSLEQNSFNIVKISYANFFLFPIVLLTRTVGRRLLKESSHSDLSMLPKPLNNILLLSLKLESILIKFISFPFGSSLICVSQKV